MKDFFSSDFAVDLFTRQILKNLLFLLKVRYALLWDGFAFPPRKSPFPPQNLAVNEFTKSQFPPQNLAVNEFC